MCFGRDSSTIKAAKEYSAIGDKDTGNLRGDIMANNCEECVHYDYDDEIEAYFCSMDLDEDEMERFLRSANNACPFYRRGDDYQTARRQ